MEEEKKDKGFVIRDRRFSAEESDSAPEKSPEGLKDEPKKEEPRPEAKKRAAEPAYPEIDFSNFVISLSSSVLFHFGEIPDPVTGKPERNMSAAKQTIDILGMLQEKTKGNLNEDEKKLVDGILFELRIRYVKEKERE